MQNMFAHLLELQSSAGTARELRIATTTISFEESQIPFLTPVNAAPTVVTGLTGLAANIDGAGASFSGVKMQETIDLWVPSFLILTELKGQQGAPDPLPDLRGYTSATTPAIPTSNGTKWGVFIAVKSVLRCIKIHTFSQGAFAGRMAAMDIVLQPSSGTQHHF